MDKIVIKFKEAIRVNASFTLGFDQETGKLRLLGKDNSILSEVDLPTEKIITNAFYDDNTKELVIDFESANQVRIPIDFTDEIEKAISDFESKVNEQFSQFQESFNEEIDNLSQEISNIEQTINENINQQIDNLSGEINALEETINESVNQNIESLNSKIDNLEDTINNNIGKQVESLNESIEEINNSKVDKVEGKQLSTIDLTNELLALLQDKYTKAEINGLDSALQQQIDEIKLILTTDDVDFDTLQEFVNALKNNVASINDIFTALSQKASKDELPTKVSDLENDLGYITEHQDISGKVEKTYVDEELQKKVDKVEGYNLSKNDFTDENLQKLNELKNYDDSEIRDKIEEIEEKNATQDTSISNLENRATLIEERLQENETKVSENTTEISNIKSKNESQDTNISNAQQIANEALAIAKGRAKANVFDTYLSMVEYLKNANNNEFNIGDNLLIKELNVPDYWISAILETNDGYYGYYEVSLLETQKVDLSNYYNIPQTDNLLENKVDKIQGKGLSTNDYTTEEKEKLSNLENYDDTAIYNELNKKANTSQLFSKDYNDLNNKPTIPTKTSQLENDSTFTTNAQLESVENAIDGLSDKINSLNKNDIGLGNVLNVPSYSQQETINLINSKVGAKGPFRNTATVIEELGGMEYLVNNFLISFELPDNHSELSPFLARNAYDFYNHTRLDVDSANGIIYISNYVIGYLDVFYIEIKGSFDLKGERITSVEVDGSNYNIDYKYIDYFYLLPNKKNLN